MTRETYRKMTGYFLQDEKKVRRIILANRLLTGIVFVSYPLYLISLLLKRDTLLPQAVLVPAVSFVVVTLFRKIVNEPRPYEKYDLPPVIDKDERKIISKPSCFFCICDRRHGICAQSSGGLYFSNDRNYDCRDPCDRGRAYRMGCHCRSCCRDFKRCDRILYAAISGILSGVIGYYMLPYQGF